MADHQTQPSYASILAVLDAYNQNPYQALVVAAQKCALTKELPFAVVCVLTTEQAKSLRQPGSRLAHLLALEKRLSTLCIPLMLVVGEPQVVLLAVLHHVQPAAIFTDKPSSEWLAGQTKNRTLTMRTEADTTPKQAHEQLLVHPYKWPGKIIDVKSVIRMFAT